MEVKKAMEKRQRPPRSSRFMNRSFAMGAFLSGIAFTVYMLWIGISGQPIPTWFWAIATVL